MSSVESAIVVPVTPNDNAGDENDDDFDETRSVESSEAGSLEDFVVADPEDDDDNESVVSDGPKTKEDAKARDLEDIDSKNIVLGKRTRRPTKFYEQTVFNTKEYRRMMLEDVPQEELHAIQSSDEDDDDDDDDEEEEDETYQDEDEDEDDEDDEEEEGTVHGTVDGMVDGTVDSSPDAQ